MKSSLVNYIVFAAVLCLASACALDNYDAPGQRLTGRLVFNETPINLGKGQVRIQLWESGWQLKKSIDVAVEPDGSFAALLYNGDYKMVIPRGLGPFVNSTNSETASDTILLTLRGSQSMDIEVTPYYLINAASFSSNGTTASSTFSVQKIINDANAKDIERVTLYLNKTQFVSNGSSLKEISVNGGDIVDLSNINLSVDLPSITPAQNYVYGRVGLKVTGIENMIFSPVQRIDF